jgi:uncharacterized peroxidase-related enzyme
MSRITAVNPQTAAGRPRELLDAVKQKLGLVPNMTRAMAHSPATLDGYLGLSGALAKGTLPAKVREQLALAVSEANGCDYCLAAHSTAGKAIGLTPDQVRDARLGGAVDTRTDALLKFARRVVDTRGKVADADLAAVRAAGWDDGAVAEVVAHVALNVFTNYFNNVAGTDLDFPTAPALHAAAPAKAG